MKDKEVIDNQTVWNTKYLGFPLCVCMNFMSFVFFSDHWFSWVYSILTSASLIYIGFFSYFMVFIRIHENHIALKRFNKWVEIPMNNILYLSTFGFFDDQGGSPSLIIITFLEKTSLGGWVIVSCHKNRYKVNNTYKNEIEYLEYLLKITHQEDDY